MAVNSVLPPYLIFPDADGKPLEGGFIYIGQPGFEARSTPKASFFDVAQTIPTGTASGAAIQTRGGFPVRNGAPAMFYVDGDFSISVTDRNGVLLYTAMTMTLALNVGGAIGPVLAPDGNLAAVGIGFSAEDNTGWIRNAPGSVQEVVTGAVVSTRTAAGTVFTQPVSGAGFVSGVNAAFPTLTSLEGLSLVAGDVLYATAADTLARLPVGTAGQALVVNAGATAPEWALTGRFTWLAPQSTASGTEKDFTGIPAWATEISIAFAVVSLSGTDNILIQIGDAGGFETTGYDGSVSGAQTTLISTSSAPTSGFVLSINVAAGAARGFASIVRPFGDNEWAYSCTMGTGAQFSWAAGLKTLSDVLTQVRITRTGSNTFDGGRVSVGYR